jgi:hypothetical protein
MTETDEAEERGPSPFRILTVVATGLMCLAIAHNALTGQEGPRREARAPVANLDTGALGEVEEAAPLKPRLATRTRVTIPPQAPLSTQQAGERALAAGIQKALAELRLYEGPADGRLGLELKKAIEAYEATHGFDVTGKPHQALLDHLQLALEIARAAEFDTAAGAE